MKALIVIKMPIVSHEQFKALMDSDYKPKFDSFEAIVISDSTISEISVEVMWPPCCCKGNTIVSLQDIKGVSDRVRDQNRFNK